MAKNEHSKTGSLAETPACRAQEERPLSRQDQELIGRELQRFYSGLVEEGIPDKFKTLLDRLGGPAQASGQSRKSDN